MRPWDPSIPEHLGVFLPLPYSCYAGGCDGGSTRTVTVQFVRCVFRRVVRQAVHRARRALVPVETPTETSESRAAMLFRDDVRCVVDHVIVARVTLVAVLFTAADGYIRHHITLQCDWRLFEDTCNIGRIVDEEGLYVIYRLWTRRNKVPYTVPRSDKCPAGRILRGCRRPVRTTLQVSGKVFRVYLPWLK